MANFMLLIAIILASANFVLSYASYLGPIGLAWTDDICWASPLACQSPQMLIYFAAGLAAGWVVMKLTSALRN